MIRSMTGFAGKNIVLPLPGQTKANMTISIKSLNSRFFETTFKMPHIFNSLETECIKILKEKLLRGHIYATMHVSNQNAFKGAIEPALNVVESYVQAIKAIKTTYPMDGELTLETLLGLPNVFSTEEQSIDEHVKKSIIEAFSCTIDELIEQQQLEGIALERDILQRTVIMAQEIEQIQQASLILVEEQKRKVQVAIKEIETDESKFAELQKNSLYAILDKIDIHEEIIRFKSHLENIIAQFKSKPIEKGKRLDFTLQELGREINTITAKCSDAVISSKAINIKVEIEKAREQVQNIV